MKWPSFEEVVEKIVTDGVSPANSSKLLGLLRDPRKSWTLRVELSAYIEGLEDLRHLCYFLEGDGTDMAFHVANRLKAFTDLFPNGQMKTLPSTNQIIQRAILWATTDGGYSVPTMPRAPPRSFAAISEEVRNQVVAERPRRRAAIQAVHQATFATLSPAERARREKRILDSQEKEAREQELQKALEEEADDTDRPPLTVDEWNAHVVTGKLNPCVTVSCCFY